MEVPKRDTPNQLIISHFLVCYTIILRGILGKPIDGCVRMTGTFKV